MIIQKCYHSWYGTVFESIRASLNGPYFIFMSGVIGRGGKGWWEEVAVTWMGYEITREL